MTFEKTQDNKLNHMCKFKHPVYVERMETFRNLFIDLDDKLRLIVEEDIEHKGEAMRTIALARTHLEQSLMYTIKTLCILGEEK